MAIESKNQLSIAGLVVAVLLSILLHLPTFWASHNEGDEMVYRGLSQEMGWDLSNYSVARVPWVNEFASRLYRSEIFPHPPLYPFLLKLLGLFTASYWLPLFLGLLFKLLIIFVMTRFLQQVTTDSYIPAAGAILVALCPILSFSSARMLTDTCFTLFLFLNAISLNHALQTDRCSSWVGAGIFFGLFLNTKYQALAYAPLPFLLIGYGYWNKWSKLKRALLLFAPCAVLIGFPHYIRMWIAYEQFGIAHLLIEDFPLKEFVARMNRRSLVLVTFYIFLLYPLLVFIFTPNFWRLVMASILEKLPLATVLIVFIYCILITPFLPFNQERYWGTLVLFAIPSFLITLDNARGTIKPVLVGLLVFSAINMSWSAFFANVLGAGDLTAEVRPALTTLEPILLNLYKN